MRSEGLTDVKSFKPISGRTPTNNTRGGAMLPQEPIYGS